jgi:hypothetical protein
MVRVYVPNDRPKAAKGRMMNTIVGEAHLGHHHDHHGHHGEHGPCETRVKVPFNNKEVFV